MSKTIELNNLDEIPDLHLLSASTRQTAKDAGGVSRDHWFVERDKIHVLPGFNVRIRNHSHNEYVRWLADQMKKGGFRVDRSLSCYVSRTDDGSSKIFVHDGHTRLEAYDLATSEGADLGLIPIAIGKEQQNQNIEDLTLSLVTSNSGRPLGPLEKAAVYKRMVGKYRWTEKQIADHLGVSTQSVSNHLLLANADPEIRQMVANESIAASVAITAIRSHGLKAAEKLGAALDSAINEGRSKATKQHLTDPALRFAKRQVPALLSIARTVQTDPGFKALSPEVQAKLAELLQGIEEAVSKKASKTKASDKAEGPANSENQQNLDLP